MADALEGLYVVVGRLAQQVAPDLAGTVMFRHGKFRTPGRRGIGAPVPPVVLVAAVASVLPVHLDALQREHLARAICAHPAFREALTPMNPIPTPTSPRIVTSARLAERLDDAARAVLGRLDPRRATPEQVRDALASIGVHVPLTLAAQWLDERRTR